MGSGRCLPWPPSAPPSAAARSPARRRIPDLSAQDWCFVDRMPFCNDLMTEMVLVSGLAWPMGIVSAPKIVGTWLCFCLFLLPVCGSMSGDVTSQLDRGGRGPRQCQIRAFSDLFPPSPQRPRQAASQT